MATLDRWAYLLQIPLTIRFPKLRLIRFDSGPPLVEGSGEIQIKSPSRFEFELIGTPADPNRLRTQLQQQRDNPYDTFSRCRLFGTDELGTEWTLGWTAPRISKNGSQWIFRGQTDGLSPHVQHQDNFPGPSTELIIALPFAHPLIGLMHIDAANGVADSFYRYRKQVLNTELELEYDLKHQFLKITAAHSPQLPPTYTENWLAEPLRIIAGQLIFPRLVARNNAADNIHVTLRQANEITRETSWAALIPGQRFLRDKTGFLERYKQLLTHIALARGKDGQPNFEAHTITRIYEELIQATNGSRWVWALTLASSIEALAKMLGGVGSYRADYDEKKSTDLIDHIGRFPEAERLTTIAVDAVKRAARTSVMDTLRARVASKVVQQEQLKAWTEIRNSVMHGSLTSPYSTEEEDQKLTSLIEMLHALTIEVLEKSTIPTT